MPPLDSEGKKTKQLSFRLIVNISNEHDGETLDTLDLIEHAGLAIR